MKMGTVSSALLTAPTLLSTLMDEYKIEFRSSRLLNRLPIPKENIREALTAIDNQENLEMSN
jgi:hypothetical protein